MYPYIGCAQHNIVTFLFPTVTLHCSGCSALWCLCIQKLIVGCTQVHMWHLTLGITSLVPNFVLRFEFSIIHGSRRTTKKKKKWERPGNTLVDVGVGGVTENTHHVKNARWTRGGGHRGGRDFTFLILLSFSPLRQLHQLKCGMYILLFTQTMYTTHLYNEADILLRFIL